jgi:hypothetical protein
VPLTITRRGFTAFLQPLLGAPRQLLIVISNPKHSAFRIRIGDVVSDGAGLFAALAPTLRVICGMRTSHVWFKTAFG